MDEKLPEGWVWTTIGGISETTSGGTPLRSHSEYYRGTIPWVKSGELRDDIINVVEEFLSEEGLLKSNAKVFPKGTPLVAIYGATVGRTGILGIDAATNQAICAILSILETFPAKYIIYWLQFQRQELIGRSAGGAQPNISQEIIRSFPFPLSPLPEQSRIVAAIEQQFTRLDSAVASLQSARAKVKQYRASLLKSAVEGELTKQWRADHPTEETGAQLLKRILAERRTRWEEEELAKMREKEITPKDDRWKQAYKEPQGADVEKLPGVPEGWCWATVEQIAQIQGGIQKQPSRVPRQNAYPYLRVANVLRGRLDLSVIEKMELFRDELETLRLKSGDLLIVEGNGSKTEIGRSALWNEEIKNCVHQNHIIRVRLDHVIPKYIDFYWNSSEGNRRVMDVAASTTGLYTLSVNKISRLPVPLPPLAEQEQIVAEVEANLTNIAKLEEVTENSLKRAEHERQSILREAFAGKLVPQDPDDEPASVLLERIREERKKRDEIEQVRRRENKMEQAQKRGKRKQVAPLYDVLVEAGGELHPEELYKRSEEQRKEKPEQERDEEFYVELDLEVRADLIVEERPSSYEVLLRAVEQNDEAVEEDGEAEESAGMPKFEMRHEREEGPLLNREDLPKFEMRHAREEEPLPDLEDLPGGEMRHAREKEEPRSLWDE